VVELFANISYFYTVVFVVAAICCMLTGSIENFIIAIFLGLFEFSVWRNDLWSDPGNMAIVHLGILICMTLSLYGNLAKKMVLLTLAMVTVDMLWVVMPDLNLPANELNFPYSYFWWQSSVNIIYFLMCVFTIVGCFRELRQNKENKGDYDGSILAREAHILQSKNLV